MSYFVLIFVLAHLVGDFILQTDKLAKLKATTLKGLIIHVLCVTVVQMLFLGVVFGLKGVLAASLAGVMHLLIDALKQLEMIKNMRLQSVYFVLDQAIHLLTIVMMDHFLQFELKHSIISYDFARVLILFVLSTYVMTIFSKMFLQDLIPNLRSEKLFLDRLERPIDALCSLLTVILFNFSWIISASTILLLIPIYLLIQKKRYGYTIQMAMIKYVPFIAFALFVSLFNFYILC